MVLLINKMIFSEAFSAMRCMICAEIILSGVKLLHKPPAVLLGVLFLRSSYPTFMVAMFVAEELEKIKKKRLKDHF